MFPELIELKEFKGYFVDKIGNVYSNHKYKEVTKMVLKEDKDGYYEVGLYKNGKRYYRRVHRLIASVFIPNPNNLPQVNHKDGNPKNNKVENLEWCTCLDNLLHSFRELKREPSITTNRPLKLFNKDTKEELIFNSIKDCAKFLRMSHEHLGKLLNNTLDINKCRKLKNYSITFIL